MSLTVILFIVIFVIAAAAVIFLFLKQYRKVAPNEVIVISGGGKQSIRTPDGSEKVINYRFKIGGGAFINPFTEKAETMTLEVSTVTIKTPEVLTAGGVPILAEAIGQVRIDTSDYALTLAIEQFLGSGTDAIREVTEAVLEGMMRSVIGSMSVEEIYRNRLGFADKVIQASQDDFARMGLQLVSFALKDVNDTQGYLDAIGRPQIAAVKRDAAVAQAEADRDAAIQTSMAKKEAEIARLKSDAEIAAASWHNEEKKAESQVKVNQQKAHADMSYELERHKISQSLKKEEFVVKKIEKENAIKLEELEVSRKQKELEANVLKPAEAKKHQVKQEAEAESFRLATEAKGKAEARRMEGEAESERIRLLGQAEAQALEEKAKAYGQYNQAAIYQMIMEVMPELARAVSEPLSSVDKIVMVGTDGTPGTSRLTGQVSEILAQLPEVVESMTGVDLKKLIMDKLNKDSE